LVEIGLSQSIWTLKGQLWERQKRRAESILLLLNGESKDFILDVGCGDGFMTSFLQGYTNFVVGVDSSSVELKIAKLKLKLPNFHFVRGDACALPFRPSTFNKITILEVLEHLPKPKLCVEEVDRCANDDVVLVVSVPFKEKLSEHTSIWGHLHSFKLSDVISFFPENYKVECVIHLPNLPIISLSKIFSCFPTNLWLTLNRLLGRIKKGYWVILKLRNSTNMRNS